MNCYVILMVSQTFTHLLFSVRANSGQATTQVPDNVQSDYDITVKLDSTWDPKMADRTSPEFKAIERQICPGVSNTST